MSVRILIGDVRSKLAELPADSVDCVVTSPPYWGLRDYGVAGQLGMEPTYQEHVAAMVAVFEDVRRVLKPTGTCWMNYGDSYATSPNGRSAADVKQLGDDDRTFRDKPFSTIQGTLKSKDLCGIPWRVAFALQDAGWYLRQDIIWAKPNPMPESIKDRCTKSHEYIFLLAKRPKYYFDAEAIAEPVSPNTHARLAQDVASQAGSDRVPGKTNGPMKAVGRKSASSSLQGGGWGRHSLGDAIPEKERGSSWKGSEFHTGKTAEHQLGRASTNRKVAEAGSGIRGNDSFYAATLHHVEKRNKRSVWTVATQPFSEAHFATFPPDLIEPCILAGCPIGGTVLDPFGGAGTTGLVADRLGRNAILIELNPEYAAMAERRLNADAGMFAEVEAA